MNSLPIQNALEYAELDSNSIQVQEIPGKGRGLVAFKDFNPGDTVFKTSNFVSSLENPEIRCNHCFVGPHYKTRQFDKCRECNRVVFCSEKCRNESLASPTEHKFECDVMKSVPEVSQYSTCLLRLMARSLWGYKSLGSSWWLQLRNMHSENKAIDTAQKESYFSMAFLLQKLVGKELIEECFDSAKDLTWLLYSYPLNTFTLADFQLSPFGAALSPTAALLNHSCDPNCSAGFPLVSAQPLSSEPKLFVTANKEIKKGEELTISYVEQTKPRHLRQESLKEQYGFGCNCSLCEKGLETGERNDPRVVSNCTVSGCKGTVSIKYPIKLDAPSLQCDSTPSHKFKHSQEDIKNAIEEAQRYLDESVENSQARKDILNNPVIKNFRETAYPKFDVTINLDIWKTEMDSPDAIMSQMRSYYAAKSIFNSNNPLLAVQTAYLAQYYQYNIEMDSRRGNTDTARNTSNFKITWNITKEALERCRNTFGRDINGGHFGSALENFLKDASPVAQKLALS